MAIRDTLRANAEHVLEPGETIQVVFAAQTTSQWFALIKRFHKDVAEADSLAG